MVYKHYFKHYALFFKDGLVFFIALKKRALVR